MQFLHQLKTQISEKSYLINKYKKYFLPLLLVGGLVLSYTTFKPSSALRNSIVDVTIPEVPDQIWELMESQVYWGPINLGEKDWFNYYDTKYKTRVRTKLTGLSARHYESDSNKSFRIRYNNEDRRFKSLASEVGL